jgi:KDO2-lipid IV(A) lauroyltransferase
MKKNPLYGHLAFKAAYRFANTFPRQACQSLAALLGRGSYAAIPRIREALRANLSAVTGASGTELDRLCRLNVSNFSKMLADYFYCTTGDPARIKPLLGEWRGIENLHAARERGKGTILVTAHLGNWELGGMLLALENMPLTVITLEEPSTELTQLRDEYRRKLGIKTIAIGTETFAFVEVINTLRNNGIVAMLIERPRENSGTPVKFFGRETPFSSGPALLWQHTDAAVLPAFVLQKNDGRYLSFIDPAVPMQQDASPREGLANNTQRIASIFETIIHNHPDQWYNFVPIWK